VLLWPRIRDGKNQRQDPGSSINIPNLIFENLLTVFWVKNTTTLLEKSYNISMEQKNYSFEERGILGSKKIFFV
jgi:hypothetical protein